MQPVALSDLMQLPLFAKVAFILSTEDHKLNTVLKIYVLTKPQQI